MSFQSRCKSYIEAQLKFARLEIKFISSRLHTLFLSSHCSIFWSSTLQVIHSSNRTESSQSSSPPAKNVHRCGQPHVGIKHCTATPFVALPTQNIPKASISLLRWHFSAGNYRLRPRAPRFSPEVSKFVSIAAGIVSTSSFASLFQATIYTGCANLFSSSVGGL
jgi:hypothetical protein